MYDTNDTHLKSMGYILWIFGFTGSHRFYFGKPISGTIYFFTLGLLEQRRRQTLGALAAAGLLDANRERPLPEIPLDVGLVTSKGSAAFHDFVASLAESGYGFRVLFVHAATQGHGAESQVAAALETLARLPLDTLVLIRGGGSRTDLAAFDSRRSA